VELIILKRLFLNGLRGTKFITSVDDRNFSREFCKIHRFFNSRITTAYYIHFKIFKEVGIACCTVRNTFSHKFFFVFASNRTCKSTGCNDHCFSKVFCLGAFQLLHIAIQLNRIDHVCYALRAKLLNLLCHSGDQRRSAFTFYNLPRIVFNLIRDSNLSAVFSFFNDQSR